MTTTNTFDAIEIRPILNDEISESLYFCARRIDNRFKSDTTEFLNSNTAHYIKMGYNMEEISATAKLKVVNNLNVGDYTSGTIALKVSTQHSFIEKDFFFSIQAHWNYTKAQNEMVGAILEQVKQYQEAKNKEKEAEEFDLPSAVEAEDEE